ncbi:hypothetical protein RCL_jg574.t1 [Rhizophagus clarus]|uniref:Uncharacterized protein n=1 Tax=Rhizophagus clarus TaxID=94130 RepID=A0A8H3QS29_9GLOM|nr:hypothetical protein RCL_jg574.t1 [Rhizophagus clarus]
MDKLDSMLSTCEISYLEFRFDHIISALIMCCIALELPKVPGDYIEYGSREILILKRLFTIRISGETYNKTRYVD